ncbi:hypothetical protein ACFYPC_08315 [Streptomyces sp. NPDC005808]|uniref:hypothetical protein n=1 Tax=Streptomyces sp. NPDC005808 TaxID=3364734 RepID=UPI0036CE75BF
MSESPTLAEALARLDTPIAEKSLHRGGVLGVRALTVGYLVAYLVACLVAGGKPISEFSQGERR